MAINEWSPTASANASGVTGVNWAEGQAPSTVNDSARAMMADVAAWYGQAKTPEYLTGVAGTNTITAAGPAALASLAAGQRFMFVPAATNTGATTLNITPSGGAALTAKSIFSRGAACVGGELEISVPALVEYDGTQFNILGSHLKGGVLDISLGTQGQISFPATQNASAGVNTLDDYEEGTWTPGVSFGGGTTGITYTTQTGQYTKVGRQVIATFNIVLSSKGSSTGTLNITGLPIAALTGPADVCTIDFGSMTTAECMMIGLINGSTTMVVKGTPAAANSTVNVTATDVSNTTSLSGTITYRSAT